MPLSSQLGGAEGLLQHLLRNGGSMFRFVYAFLEGGPLVNEAQRLGYETVVIRANRLRDLPDYARTVFALRSWIRAHDMDIVLSWMPKSHLYAGVAALGLRVRPLWFQHGVTHGQTLDRLTTLIPSDGVLCCSKMAAEYQGRLFPRRRTFVLYPGVAIPESRLSSMAARKQLGLPERSPLVGMVARLERWKGAHIFIATAECVWKSYPDAMLYIVGGPHKADPDYALELQNMIGRLSRPTQFLLVGQKPRSETMQWQAAADLLVHAAPVEPFGMVIAEAMALGKAVIASNSGGPAEMIEQGVNGILTDGTSQEMADAVLDLLDHPERRHQLEEKAYVRAMDFSVPAFVGRLEGILTQVRKGQA
jgi:glycosyltransferase involved in cell wall biosynthesis